MTTDPPVRPCCGERHFGALCPDGSVMCCLCFNKYPLSAMSEEGGVKTDVCPNCATIERLQAEVATLRAERDQLRAALAVVKTHLDNDTPFSAAARHTRFIVQHALASVSSEGSGE